MLIERQKEIANSFSKIFQEFDLNIELTSDEFHVFDEGVFSLNMDEKWDVFVLERFMYWSRSWTGHCIYKVEIIRLKGAVILKKGFVTRDKIQYNSADIEKDKILFLQILQAYVGREDIYVDSEFQLDLIKRAIDEFDPNDECTKSIGYQALGLTKRIYNSIHGTQCQVKGLDELERNTSDKRDDEPLLSLYLQNKKTRDAITYYFNKEGDLLLGRIVVEN
jgi:8-oxo-dGTP diphosphatase